MTRRSIFLLIATLLQGVLFQCSRVEEELVSIPDNYFLNALLESGVDKNSDGYISYPEAEGTTDLDLKASNISDLTGIEAFIHLDSLSIRMNPLKSFDLSQNLSLEFLRCTGCELSQLDVSANKELRYLDCSGGAAMGNALSNLDLSENSHLEILVCPENKLTSLDLSRNLKLTEVSCGRNLLPSLDVTYNLALSKLIVNNNYLTSLDVSKNNKLNKLITCGNQLTSLDISVNRALVLIGVDNMPTIHEVCVWTSPFPPEGIEVLSGYSPNVIFRICE